MKKLMLLSTALLCAGQLYGQDINQEIADIKANQSFCNMSYKEFIATIGDLNTRFPKLSRHEIAKLFKTEIALDYIRMNYDLLDALAIAEPKARLKSVLTILTLKKLADPNFTYEGSERTPLGMAYDMALLDKENNNREDSKKVIKALLEHGARPNPAYRGTTLFQFAKKLAGERCYECELLKILQDWMTNEYNQLIEEDIL